MNFEYEPNSRKLSPHTAPVLTVMDGFGRELLDQYYKAGSSLEVMCAVDRLPAHPLPNVIEWRHGDRTLPLRNTSLGQRSVSQGPFVRQYQECELKDAGDISLRFLLHGRLTLVGKTCCAFQTA